MSSLLDTVRTYLPEERVEFIADALEFASQAHAGQSRRSGHPYIEHPIQIASYLAELHLDTSTVAAGLLHDVVEDCGVTVDELRIRFGDDVARLVDGVTKLTRMDVLGHADIDGGVRNEALQAESLRKMLVAMAEDIRVVLIKLADRLHNMRTLRAMPSPRRISISQETLDIYAPLAHRLGMGEIKWQLEDLAFRYLEPNRYRSISRLLSSKRQEREEYVAKITDILRDELSNMGMVAEVTGRPKHIYSIFRKSESYAEQGKKLGDIYDLFAVRVLVKSIPDCYGALGVVHGLWRPLPGLFDDYIASPKENMYQSLHTTVMCIGGVPIEVQVRTNDMHQIAEYGVASHWSYKEGKPVRDMKFDEKMTWMRQLLDWQRELVAAEDFLESVKTDLFNDQVFVYTPRGDVKELPTGSTPIDFAYHIHTELGNRCIGSKINGKLVSLSYPLNNGDTVEIMTSKVARGPSLDWLNSHLGYTRTANARQRIRAWFRRQEKDINIRRGRELFKKEARRLSAPIDDGELLRVFRQETMEDLYAALGSSQINITQVIARIAVQQESPQHHNGTSPSHNRASDPITKIKVLGVGDLLTRLGLCCQPMPDDAIIGYVTRTRGVTVHRQNCPNLRNENEEERLIPVAWGETHNLYPVRLGIEAWDRVGLLRDITATVSEEGVSISSTHTQTRLDGSDSIHLTAMISSIGQLSRLFARLEAVRGVRNVVRVAAHS